MTFVKCPEFLQERIVKGLTQTQIKLGNIRTNYTKFGNNVEVLKLLFQVEKLVSQERSFQEESN